MKKAIYIHGLGGSGNGSSASNIKKFLEGEYDFSASTYNLLDPKKAFSQIKKDAEDADLIIASSLGGFYASALNVSGKVILLNPCLKPQEVIKNILFQGKLPFDEEEKCVNEWNEIQQLWKEKRNLSNFAGIFADNDELFHFKDYFDEVFRPSAEINSMMISGTHQIAKNDHQLKDAFEAAKKILN